MKGFRLFFTVVSCCLLLSSWQQGKIARNALRTNQLDTLMLHERLAWRANTIGWLLLQPNIAMEWTLGSHNWNRWTLGLNGRLWWANNDWEVPYIVHDLREARMEVRRYWHGQGLKRVWFVGAYGGYTDYDLKISRTGYRGDGFVAGLTAGTVTPLYGYANGSSIDLEISANAGIVLASIEEYVRQNNSYVVTQPRDGRTLVWNALPWAVNNDVVRLSLVYRFGPSVADRYRRRIKIDEQYRIYQNDQALKRDSAEQAHQREQARRRDSLERVDYERRFEQQRQALARQHLRDSLARIKSEKP